MHRSTILTRKVAKYLFAPLEGVIVAVVNTLLLFRLGNMQLEGVPSALGATLALLAATTSLLFNRARAYPSGALQRRSLLAAELCLRAFLLAAFGAVLVALIFPVLQSPAYPPTPVEKFPTQWVPLFCAVLPVLFFVSASLCLVQVGQVLAPSMLASFNARVLKNATRG